MESITINKIKSIHIFQSLDSTTEGFYSPHSQKYPLHTIFLHNKQYKREGKGIMSKKSKAQTHVGIFNFPNRPIEIVFVQLMHEVQLKIVTFEGALNYSSIIQQGTYVRISLGRKQILDSKGSIIWFVLNALSVLGLKIRFGISSQ